MLSLVISSIVHLGYIFLFPSLDSVSCSTFFLLCWDTVAMCLSLSSNKLIDVQQLAHSLLQMYPITGHQVMFFFGKTTFCANGYAQLYQLCCHTKQHAECLPFSSSFVLFFSPFSSLMSTS